VTVRRACPEDSSAILALLRQLAAFEGGTIALTEATLRGEGFGEDARFTVLLAEDDGQPTGIVIVFRGYSSWQAAPTLVIHDLFVSEDARGAGTGRALLIAAAELATEWGCCRMDVNVLAWNTRARAFYETLGFAPLADWLPYRLDNTGMDHLCRPGINRR
jgi:GNAT superfamily N-acetyltransferase